jgi:hypothetical protein
MTDPRFSQSRFGPWSNGPISDVNEPAPEPVPTAPTSTSPTPPTPRGGGFGGLDQGYDPSTAWRFMGGGGGGMTRDTGGMPGGMMPGGAESGFGSGGFSQTHGPVWMAEGGVVPTEDDQDEDDGMPATGTVDPMAMVRSALQHGRKLFNVQSEFGGGDTVQGAADGGPIGAEDDQQQGVLNAGQKPTDPRDLLAYIVGDGAVQPAVARALEMAADPQGQMDPYQRSMATIGKMQDPNAAFAYMQGLRRKASGFIAAAGTALKKGNFPMAAHYANQAFANIPGSDGVRFAPHQGGLAISQGQGGAQEQEPEAAEPTDDGDQDDVQGAADGGMIDPADTSNPGGGDDDQQGFEDGGEVDDEDDVTGTVTPGAGFAQNMMDSLPAQAIPDENPSIMDQIGEQEMPPMIKKAGVSLPGGGGGDTGLPNVQVLAPEQAHKVLGQGAFDAIAEKGLGAYLRDLIGISPMVTPAKEQPFKPSGDEWQGPDLPQGPAQQPDPNRPDLNPNRGDSHPLARAGGDEEARANAMRNTPQGKRAVDAQGRTAGEAAAQDPEEARVTKREKMLDVLAQKKFPWSSEAEAREKYKSEMRKYLYGGDIAQTKANTEGKERIENLRAANQMDRIKAQQEGLNYRNENSTATRKGIAYMQQKAKVWSGQNHELMATVRGELAANPGLSPEEAMKRVAPAARQMGIDPQELADVAHMMANPELYQQGQGQPRPAAQGGQQGAQRKVVTFKSGPYAGKPMIDNGDGTFSPAGK